MRACVLILGLVVGCGRVGFDSPTDLPVDSFIDRLPGLLAFFPFDDDPRDGVDNRAIGAGLAGCLTTCPTLVQGVSGSAYQFNGTTDVIRYRDQPALHTQAGTVALWANHARLPAVDAYLVFASKPFGTLDANSWEVFLSQRTMLSVFGGGDSTGVDAYALTTWSTPNNTWVHLAFTWGSKVRLYADGIMIAEAVGAATSYDSNDVFIGADFDSGSAINHVKGAIDNVYIFSAELSAADIEMLATP